ncbi:MAG: hypothetical protein JW787_17695, partial [Sedimentisphaerales bacterium]|nr:hypothetical protein [Sedimentisphaerales bacterium]
MMCKYFTYLIFLSLLPALCGSNTVSAVEEIWGEAEAASSITTPLQILDDTAASGGQYIANPTVGGASNTNPPSTGIATYNITIEEGGTYKLFLRVLCTVSGSSDDSCYIRIQGATPSATPGTGGWTNCNNIDGTMAAADTQVWFWAQARQYDSEPGNVITFDIPAGSYVLEIAYREDGLKIDGFVITNDPDVTTADLPDEIPSEEPCISKLAITNGDFETGGGVSITDVNGWYDN